MRHILADGSILQLSQLPRQLFQPIKCSIDGHFMQMNEINTSLQQAVPFLHATGKFLPKKNNKDKRNCFLQEERFKSIPIDQ